MTSVVQAWDVVILLSKDLFILYNRLAIYYLNTVSKGYQQANIDLKRKMQMVSINILSLCFSCFLPFSLFLSSTLLKMKPNE